MLQCREGWWFFNVLHCSLVFLYNLFACGFFVFLSLFHFYSFHSTSPDPQQPQLGNLLQVNRTLGRNVPLASQLILMPNGAVAAVQQEVPPTQSPGVHADTDQVSGPLPESSLSPASATSHSGLCLKLSLYSRLELFYPKPVSLCRLQILPPYFHVCFLLPEMRLISAA